MCVKHLCVFFLFKIILGAFPPLIDRTARGERSDSNPGPLRRGINLSVHVHQLYSLSQPGHHFIYCNDSYTGQSLVNSFISYQQELQALEHTERAETWPELPKRPNFLYPLAIYPTGTAPLSPGCQPQLAGGHT